MGESIRLFVIAEVERLTVPHEIHGIGSKSNEDEFHDKEIEASPDEDEIEVACDEDDEK